jgi:hypothetical protein
MLTVLLTAAVTGRAETARLRKVTGVTGRFHGLMLCSCWGHLINVRKPCV